MAYSDEQKTDIINQVCKRIIEGESMRNILKDESLPHLSTFLDWISANKAKSEQYARAMEIRGELLFEEMIDIADDGTNDWMDKYGKDGEIIGSQINTEHVQRSKLRVDTRKWYLSKLNPKKFGDKIDANLNHEGKIQLEQITGMVIK